MIIAASIPVVKPFLVDRAFSNILATKNITHLRPRTPILKPATALSRSKRETGRATDETLPARLDSGRRKYFAIVGLQVSVTLNSRYMISSSSYVWDVYSFAGFAISRFYELQLA